MQYISLTASILFAPALAQPQDPPGQDPRAPSEPQSHLSASDIRLSHLDDFALLVEVWSLVKYIHPAGINGEVDFDQEFFALLPAVMAAESDAQTQAILAEWVTSLGDVPNCDLCVDALTGLQIAQTSPARALVSDSERLGESLASTLSAVWNNRPIWQQHHYLTSAQGSGNIVFTNEHQYLDQPLTLEYRLLGLARYWSAIRYWQAYNDQLSASWGDQLVHFAPRFIQAGTPEQLSQAYTELAAMTGDSHSQIGQRAPSMQSSGCQFPITFEYVDNRVVVTGVTDDANAVSLQVGDSIHAVNGLTLEAHLARSAPAVAASRRAAVAPALVGDFLSSPCDADSVVVVEREGRLAIVTSSVTAQPLDTADNRIVYGQETSISGVRRLPDNLLLIDLSSIQENEIGSILEVSASADGLIFDLREYPQWVLYQLLPAFVDREAVFARMAGPLPQTPGEFFYYGGAPTLRPAPLGARVDVPAVALIDINSISRAEFFAMAMRAAGITLIGEQTAGADGNVSAVPLVGGGFGAFSGLRVYNPDGTPTQRIGIIPDLRIPRSVEGVVEGRDEQLEAAIEFLLEGR